MELSPTKQRFFNPRLQDLYNTGERKSGMDYFCVVLFYKRLSYLTRYVLQVFKNCTQKFDFIIPTHLKRFAYKS